MSFIQHPGATSTIDILFVQMILFCGYENLTLILVLTPYMCGLYTVKWGNSKIPYSIKDRTPCGDGIRHYLLIIGLTLCHENDP